LIDIHSHVLFGLDDGARTLEESAAMARMAAEHGTTDLVATPHASPEYRFDPERIAERLAEVQAVVGGAVRLHTGCDFHLSYDNIQDALAHPSKYTIDGRNYLLVEFSELLIFRNTEEIFARLMDAGMIPVITHPERNGLLRQRLEQIAAWVERGARVQVTAQSLTGEFGRRAQEFSCDLLDHGLVHVLASDAHDTERRPPRLDAAYRWVSRHYSEALAEALCVANPQAALAGEPMSLPAAEASRKWFGFWK
jgi:protein-tyrosine phosphatase